MTAADTVAAGAGQSPRREVPVGLAGRIGLALPDRSRRAGLAVLLAVSLAIMLLSWHALALEPQPGLDHGWQAALHMALHAHVTFGSHLIFTYGPLGFLSVPTLWYGGTGSIAVIYALLLRLALAASLFLAARRSYGTATGAVVALLLAGASVVALEPVPFLIVGVWMLDRDLGERRRLLLLAAGGALAGLELLNKESIGIELSVMAAVVALAVTGRRRTNLGATLVPLALALLAGWAIAGQELGALPDYARNAARIVSGYAAAMGIESGGLGIVLQYPAGALAFALGLAAALQMTRGAPARRRWGIVAVWITFCFFEYKEGFVRHDAGHAEEFFAALMGGFLAFSWRPQRRLIGLGMTAILLLLTVAAALGNQQGLSGVFDPPADVSSAVTQLHQVSSASERAAIIADGRRAIESALPLDPETLKLVQGSTVHVAPYQAQVAWAYRLDWRPLPLFQSYSAYTTGLDQDDADALNSARAPQRILRRLEPGIDGRLLAFDEGLTTRTMLCRYQELRTTPTWQVLARGANRCGAPVALSTVHAGWGQAVAVPAPPSAHSFVFVRIGGAAVGGLERLYALIYKPAQRHVVLDGVSHRLVPGTATDGLLLRTPAAVDYTPPFNLAPESSTIAVTRGGLGGGGKPLTFSFFAQSIDAGAQGPDVAGPRAGSR